MAKDDTAMTFSAAEVEAQQSIYIVSGGPDYLKIGISQDVHKRVSGIQTGCPHTVRLIRSWRTPFARKVEHHAHSVLGKWRVAGEWFDVPIRAAELTIERLLAANTSNPSHAVDPKGVVLFCNNCRHCGSLRVVPKAHIRFRCTNCRRDDRVHVILF